MLQHEFVNVPNDRQVRVVLKDLIDRFKKKKSQNDEYEYSGSEEDEPTIGNELESS